MRYHGIHFDHERIGDFCRRHGVSRLAGSILRQDFGPSSDIDVLLEFAPNATPSLLELGGMQVELSEMLGREVDLKTPGFLSSDFRDQVLREALTQYAA